MPYIPEESRNKFEQEIILLAVKIHIPGELNYVISKIIHEYLNKFPLCYSSLNKIMGVLECAKQEFYRTVVAPYEDLKRRENGSVSKLDKEETE